MSNSSAYSNILLKAPVQPQSTAVQKREQYDDHSSADFHQALRDARDSLRDQNRQASKPVAHKKSDSVIDRKSIGEASSKKKIADESAAANKASVKNRRADCDRHQNTVDRNSGIQKDASVSNKKSEISKKSLNSDKADIGKDVSGKSEQDDATLCTNIVVTPTPLAAAQTQTGLPTHLLTNGEAAPGDEKSSEADLTIISDSFTAMGEAAINAQTMDKKIGEQSVQAVSPEDKLQQLLAQQAAEVTDSSAVAQEDVSALAVGVAGANSLVKAADNSIYAAAISDAKNLLSASTKDSLNTDKAAAQTAVTDASSKIDAGASASALASDSKSSFEKAMQSAVTESGKQADSALSANASQNSLVNSSSSTALDSLIRFNDTQTPAARNFVVQTAVAVPVGQPQWSQAVGERVLWLAAQNVTSAEIHLHPEDLGPMQVKVSVNQEQATVNFTSHHPQVREVLDQNLNRLREMFSDQGMNLNVDVSDKSFSRQHGDSKDHKNPSHIDDSFEEEDATVAMSSAIQKRLVDHYA